MAINGHFSNEPFANVFWALLGGGSTATQAGLDAWTTSFLGVFTSTFMAMLDPTVILSGASSTLFQPSETALHSSVASTAAGTASGAAITDTSACKVISWTSSVYWRGGKPRTYLPGIKQADTTDWKTLTPAAVTQLRNNGSTFHTGVNGLSAAGITQTQHGFVSFMSGGVERNPSLFFPITGATAHPRFGNQRRRLGPWVP